MKISFYTTCMKRMVHLQKTLPQNLSDNLSTKDVDIEFVVVNYNSLDSTLKPNDEFYSPIDLDEWMLTDPDMSDAIEDGRLIYARHDGPEKFYHAHAKNMAARLSTGDILCNLDADNFTGPQFGERLAELFTAQPDVFINPSHNYSKQFRMDNRGFVGRIAMPAKMFFGLGGYNEKVEQTRSNGWSGEDTNLMRRAKLVGKQHLVIEEGEFLQTIQHGHDARVVNVHDDPKAALDAMKKDEGKGRFVSAIFAVTGRLPVLAQPVVANEGVNLGRGLVHLGLEQTPRMIEPMDATSLPAFNMKAEGVANWLEYRFNQQVISLTNQDVQPS